MVLDIVLATSKERIPMQRLGSGFLFLLEDGSRRRACLRLLLTWFPILSIQGSATISAREISDFVVGLLFRCCVGESWGKVWGEESKRAAAELEQRASHCVCVFEKHVRGFGCF